MSQASPPALRRLVANLSATPRALWETAFRSGRPTSDRTRAAFVFGNVFYHIHSTRVHRWSLRWPTTWGLGLITFWSFALTVVTGILLMFYYMPHPEAAYQSMKDIHFVVPTGRFVRNLHRWACNVMVVMGFMHMARVFYATAYRAPREFNWVAGIFLLALTLALSFTGYLLPWDQLAYWAITIGANIAQSPREVTDALGITHIFDPGGLQKLLLLGSEEVGQEALIRFYLLHIMILPIGLVALLAVHFWRIRKDGGLARPDDVDQRLGPPPHDTYPVFTEQPKKTFQLAAIVRGRTPQVNRGPENTLPAMPHLFYAEVGVLMFTIFLCLFLSIFWDAPLKELANPQVPENPAKAPWYFLGLQEIVSFSAFMGGVGIPTLCLMALGLIPYLDRERDGTGVWFGGPGGVRLFLLSVIFGLAAVIGVEAFAIQFGWLREWWLDVPQLLVTSFNPGTVLVLIYFLYSVWVVRRYDSTRAGAVAVFTCFLCGFIVLTIIGTYLRGPNWEFYWSQANWPVH